MTTRLPIKAPPLLLVLHRRCDRFRVRLCRPGKTQVPAAMASSPRGYGRGQLRLSGARGTASPEPMTTRLPKEAASSPLVLHRRGHGFRARLRRPGKTEVPAATASSPRGYARGHLRLSGARGTASPEPMTTRLPKEAASLPLVLHRRCHGFRARLCRPGKTEVPAAMASSPSGYGRGHLRLSGARGSASPEPMTTRLPKEATPLPLVLHRRCHGFRARLRRPGKAEVPAATTSIARPPSPTAAARSSGCRRC